MMSEHEKQTEFLKECLRYDNTPKNHKLAEEITQIQRDERRVRQALKVTGGLAAVAAVGLSYSAIFLDYFPQNVLGFTAHFLTQIFCVAGLVSIICLLIFAYLGSLHREELNRHREDCRETVTKFMECRLEKPVAPLQQDSGAHAQPVERKPSPNWETQRQTNTQQTQLS
jgi:uncharacterized membrane protein